MNWYKEVLTKKYAQFEGRAHRTESWMFVLFNFVISVVLTVIDMVLGLTKMTGGLGVLSLLYSLAVLVPTIALGVRRLHDTGRTGLFYLLVFVPCIGILILILFWVGESQ